VLRWRSEGSSQCSAASGRRAARDPGAVRAEGGGPEKCYVLGAI